MVDAFKDRSDQMFGREVDIRRLSDRAMHSGLTAVVARPLMGKTWTLSEMARRLSAENNYLFGYHESKAAESSHLLYAVSNLYARWLADSTMRGQAISQWERHKDSLVPRIGQMFGTLIETLAGTVFPEGVGGLVSKAFDGLAGAQNDLRNGGLSIAPLSYDEALSLTALVAKISQRRIVLILDAWEKSPSVRFERATLEAYLHHLEDWPNTHIFLAIRNPEADSTKTNDDAYQHANDLCRLSRDSKLYELKLMAVADAEEQARLVTFVRSKVPAANHIEDHNLVEWINGYPGVLNFWTSDANRTHLTSAQDLQQEAANAQTLRYSDLDPLLKELRDDRIKLAARLAFFPRLDMEKWRVFESLLMQDIKADSINDLVDFKILIDDPVPTYGHDTRHAAARQWFIGHFPALIRREGEVLVESLASRITGMNDESLPIMEALHACSDATQQVRMTVSARCLIHAIAAVYSEFESIFDPSFDLEYPAVLRRNPSCAPLMGMALVNRGSAKFQREDIDGALIDFSAVIVMPGATLEQIAKALNNRGYAKSHDGDDAGALVDYNAALEVRGALPQTCALALLRRGIIKSEGGDVKGALADFSAVIVMPGAPSEQVADALYNRGITRMKDGDVAGALVDFSAVIVMPIALPAVVAHALANRGAIKIEGGDVAGALADYSAVLDVLGAPPELVAKVRVSRGAIKSIRGDVKGALADFSAVIDMPGAQPETVQVAIEQISLIKK